MKSTLIVILIILAITRILAASGKDPSPLDKLRSFQSKYYDIRTDLDPELVRELAQRMDVMFDQYQKQFSEFKFPSNLPRTTVFLFRRHDLYMGFTHFAGANTGGGVRTGTGAFSGVIPGRSGTR